jgi:hypothetical protein
MWNAFYGHSSDLAAVLAISAICIAVVATAGIKAWCRTQAGKHDAELKLEMIARGMSADEITRVLAAKSTDSTLAETAFQKKA